MKQPRLPMLAGFWWAASFAGMCAASQTDQVYLRDGQLWTGIIFDEKPSEYSFVPSSGGPLRRIPRDAVKFVVYADPAKADKALGLSVARGRCKLSAPCAVQVLTGEGLGEAVLAAARNAQSNVWVSGYAFSSELEGPIGAFYAVLAAKVKQGVEVVIIAEYGQGTPPSVKQNTRNFVTEMARYGMKVYLLGERKVLHKKLVIVDGKIVFLGSSNLSTAGTVYNQDLNLRVENPDFVRQVIADSKQNLDRATSLEKWKD